MNQLAFDIREPWLPDHFSLTALSEPELRVYEALYYHQGAASAVLIEQLAFEAFPFKPKSGRERETRDLLKTLTERHHIAIATSIRKPRGAYLILEAEEIKTYTNNLIARGLSDFRRAAVLNKVSLPVFLGQLRLRLEEGGNDRGEI